MKSRFLLAALALSGALLPLSAPRATGLATCDSGARESWQPQEKLTALLKQKGWQVRRIKEDGGCYEVYALNEKGERVEAYFHPRSLAPVPTGSKDHKG
ncbi:MAG TPA: PepSY domain-containing protein [Burkholderiales bacterium]|nr:PepSY domain-containing protein [Burkholderiales bacterium]